MRTTPSPRSAATATVPFALTVDRCSPVVGVVSANAPVPSGFTENIWVALE